MCGIGSYDLYSYGLFPTFAVMALYSHGLSSYDLYRYGLHSQPVQLWPYIVMAYQVMTYIVMVYIPNLCSYGPI